MVISLKIKIRKEKMTGVTIYTMGELFMILLLI